MKEELLQDITRTLLKVVITPTNYSQDTNDLEISTSHQINVMGQAHRLILTRNLVSTEEEANLRNQN